MTAKKQPKVSIIIPTYNRYDALYLCLTGIKKQTHENIEIIIIDDNSSDKRYQQLSSIDSRIIYKKLNPSSRQALGFPSAGYVRNIGLDLASGEYIAFTDDDDYWFEDKLEKQIKFLELNKSCFLCSEALIGNGLYNQDLNYKKMNSEHFYKFYRNLSAKWSLDELPDKFNKSQIQQHNCIITSSVIISKTLYNSVGKFKEIPLRGEKQSDNSMIFEDWNYWIRCLDYTDCFYIKEPLLYYDGRIKPRGPINKLKQKICDSYHITYKIFQSFSK